MAPDRSDFLQISPKWHAKVDWLSELSIVPPALFDKINIFELGRRNCVHQENRLVEAKTTFKPKFLTLPLPGILLNLQQSIDTTLLPAVP